MNTETLTPGTDAPADEAPITEATPEPEYLGTATYSPEDNKLRFYPYSRLSSEDYAKIKAQGFSWAPRQELFVAGMWTPARADFLTRWCGEIGDEDTALVDRAVDRAERFEGYRANRTTDAHRARDAVSQITDGIPMGQPILVGHHSERHARKHADQIERGMEKAVKMWETAQYWKARAAGALHHAKYKELPEVRARRIKTIEADKRKAERSRTEAESWLRMWSVPDLTHEQALRIANQCRLYLPRKEGDRPDFDGRPTAYDALTGSHPTLYAPRTLDEVVSRAKSHYPHSIAHWDRWIEHYTNRLEYERAMLGEQGGLAVEQFDVQPGGRVLVGSEWCVVLRVTRRDGKVQSMRVVRKWGSLVKAEEVQGYQPPTEEQAAAVAEATKLDPLCNYPGEGFKEMTSEAYKRLYTDARHTRVIKATDTHGAHRARHYFHMGTCSLTQVYLTDAKRVDPPKPKAAPAVDKAALMPEVHMPAAIAELEKRNDAVAAQAQEAAPFDALKTALKGGVQVVQARQLFPTPVELADTLAEMAGDIAGLRVLEPSAGTGRLLDALARRMEPGRIAHVVAVEVNGDLARALRGRYPAASVLLTDFLIWAECTGERFDRIVMNPPFENGADIRHITTAAKLLAPGGRLVAVCAAGPRQKASLEPLATASGGVWEDLPPGVFASEGTNVRTAIVVIEND